MDKLNLEELERILRGDRKLANRSVMDYLVLICLVSIIAYSMMVAYFHYKHQLPPPPEITDKFYNFFGVELIAMATIKISGNLRDIFAWWKGKKSGDTKREDDY